MHLILREMNIQMSKETINLTKALKVISARCKELGNDECSKKSGFEKVVVNTKWCKLYRRWKPFFFPMLLICLMERKMIVDSRKVSLTAHEKHQ
jgi:DNA recombination protein RmuC